MQELAEAIGKSEKTGKEYIRVELSDWLFNAGILGFIRILSFENTNQISDTIEVCDTYIEFNREVFEGFTNKFFETAFRFHGKYDSIKDCLNNIKNEVDNVLENGSVDSIGRRLRIDRPNEETIVKALVAEIGNRWKGVAYETFFKIKKSELDSLDRIGLLVNDMLNVLREEREFFVEKEVQTFLRGIIGSGSFLNKSVASNQKNTFKKDFETPLISGSNKVEKKFNCIHCNSRKAKKDTIFSTGLVFYQGLNKDSVNFVWDFDPKLPLCEICELIYFCHWAGFTKGFDNKSYLFVNDDSSLQELWGKNQLLTQELLKDKKENVLINYFHELLVRQEQISSTYTLQNIAFIEVDLQKDIMPKVISLHVSRHKAQFIKENHEKLKWQASRFYKIKDEYNNVLRQFLRLILQEKLNYRFVNRLLKYYLQSRDETKNFVTVNYNPSNIQHLVVLTSEYFRKVKNTSNNMESKFIWHIYHLGNDMRQLLIKNNAQNKINGIAYRLLNAVRANDESTFLNVLLRLYIGYEKEVPKSLVNTLEGEEKFQTLGHSYINGLLGESFKEKESVKQ